MTSHRAYRPCPMKGGMPCCSGTPKAVRECGCTSCELWQREEARDPFHSNFGYKEHYSDYRRSKACVGASP